MPYLERIVMNNFKSFAGRVSVSFEHGFTVIAGPNGSGKSNVVDAITFVLGVTSAKSIRADRMSGLIFNGGTRRKPAEFCEVTLHIRNDSVKELPEEITIKRRISKSGVSAFKYNGKTVPKRKIIEVMRLLGLSTERYNIIMQGDITKIIDMNPVQRRAIIDDLAGITEFNEKKARAEAELEKVTQRVNEMMLIISEKEQYVEKLRKEKEAAEKYLELTGKLRKARASLTKITIQGLEARYNELSDEIAELESSAKAEGMDELDREIERLQKEMLEIDREIEKESGADVVRKREALMEALARKKERLVSLEREIRSIRDILDSLGRIESSSEVVKFVRSLGMQGVFGTVGELIRFKPEHKLAIMAALAGHSDDIVVDTDSTAARIIKELRKSRVGRARFLPLNRIQGKKKVSASYAGSIGAAIDLVEFDQKYRNVVEFLLADTLVFGTIDDAVKVKDRVRMVTLQGDLIEKSGAMVGGYVRKAGRQGALTQYMKKIEELERDRERLEDEIVSLERQMAEIEKQREKESMRAMALRQRKSEIMQRLDEIRRQRKERYEEILRRQEIINRKKIERAKIEARLDNERIKMKEYSDVKEFFDMPEEKLVEMIGELVREINSLGNVNLKAIEDWKTINTEFLQLKEKLKKLLDERDKVLRTAEEIQRKRTEKFMEVLSALNEKFSRIYHDLTGGEGILMLEEEGNIDSGLLISVNPAGKRVQNIDLLSGGEKSLAAIAFLFAVQQYKSSIFYVLDEIDAALDSANVLKVAKFLKKYSHDMQFIVISHRDVTIQMADAVFGVTMEDGASKIFSIRMPKEGRAE